MISIRFFLLLLIAIFSQLIFAGSDPVSDLEACQKHFARHSESAEFSQLTNLPGVLQGVQTATLMVRFDLASEYTTLPYLEELVASNDGLWIPEDLQVITRNKMVFVAHGTKEGLTKLWKRISQSSSAQNAGFRLIDYALARAPLAFPNRSIPLDEKKDLAEVDQEIKNKMSARDKAFAVYNIGDDQVIFFLPRPQVGDGFDPVVLRQERLNISSIPRMPVSWSNWLLKRSQDLDKKTILYVGEWAVVSLSAYKKLYELDHMNSPSLPSVDTDFTVALSSCFGFSCAIEAIASPPTPVADLTAPVAHAARESSRITAERESIDIATIGIILQFLKENRGEIGVTRPGGLEDAFLQLEKFVKAVGDAAVAAYREDIKNVGFFPSDYNGLFRVDSSAQARFVKAWRAFVVRGKVRFNTRDLNERWVSGSIKSLPSDI